MKRKRWMKWAVGAGIVGGIVLLMRGRAGASDKKLAPKAGKGKHDWRAHLEAVIRDEPSMLPEGWTVDNVLRWIQHESGGNPYSTTPKGNERGLSQIHEGEWDSMGGDVAGWRKLKGEGEKTIDYAWHAKTALRHINYLAERAERFINERAQARGLAADDAWTDRHMIWFTKLWHALPTFARDVFVSTEKRANALPADPSDLEEHVLGGFDAALEKFAKYGKPTKTLKGAWERLTRGPNRVAFGTEIAKNA